MNILIYALSKSDEIDRIKLFLSGSIKSNHHNVKITFVGQGIKPDKICDNFDWIDRSNIPFSNRHIYSLEMAIKHDDVDYVIFCDNDVMMDIDYFIENEGKSKSSHPTIWTSSPGMKSNPLLDEVMKKHAQSYLKNLDLDDLYMGFCTTVINKPLIEKIKNNIAVIDSVKKVSTKMWENLFVVDVQISIISFLMGATHMQGGNCGSTCWPAYMASPVLNKKGKLWHIHGVGRSSLIDNDSLISNIRHGPFDKQDLPPIIYKNMYKKFNVRDIINKKFISNWGWAAWVNNSAPMQNSKETYIKTLSRRNGTLNILNDIEYNWHASSNGFTAHRNNDIIDFFWHNKSGDIFGIFRNSSDSMLEGSVIVLNKI